MAQRRSPLVHTMVAVARREVDRERAVGPEPTGTREALVDNDFDARRPRIDAVGFNQRGLSID